MKCLRNVKRRRRPGIFFVRSSSRQPRPGLRDVRSEKRARPLPTTERSTQADRSARPRHSARPVSSNVLGRRSPGEALVGVLRRRSEPSRSERPDERARWRRRRCLSRSLELGRAIKSAARGDTETGKKLAAEEALRAKGEGPAHVDVEAASCSGTRKRRTSDVTLYRDHAGWCPYCQKVWMMIEEKQIP